MGHAPPATGGSERQQAVDILWKVDGGFDTMYTVWNPLDRAQELLANLYYGSAGKTFKLPLHMEERASAMIDIGELIRTQQPDQDGSVIPLDTHGGSLDLGPASGEPEDLMTAILSSGIYNPRKATCGGGCELCVGMTGDGIDPSAFSLPVSNSTQGIFHYTLANGFSYYVTNNSTWSSSATAIASVQTYGQSSPGLATGVSAGTANISASYTSFTGIPVNAGQICNLSLPPSCPPPMQRIIVSAPATVPGPPDHIAVVTDNTNAYLCPIGTSRTRSVNYNVIAKDLRVVSSPLSVLETVDPSTYSSCNGSQVTTSSQCTPIPTGNYTDGFNPGCPNTQQLSNGCGYTFTDQEWEWCPPLGTPVPLGHIGTDVIHNNSISLGGNTEGFPKGTTFPH